MLPGETMPVSHPAPPTLRFARFQQWLVELGYAPVVVGAQNDRRHTGYAEASRLIAATPALTLRARRERPRLVFAFSALCAPALHAVRAVLGRDVLLVADVLGIRSIETEQTTRRAALRPLNRQGWRILERSLFGRVDLALPVNDRHAEIVRLFPGNARVRTIRCGAEEALLHVEPGDRSAVGIPPDKVAVVFLGSLVCSRLDPIFEALELLEEPQLNRSFSLVVIGDGPDLETYRRRAAARGWLGETVVFLGGLPRPSALAAAAACDIAYSECWSDHGFPTKVYEYLALGLPVVVEGKPQMKEVLHEGHDALFFHTPRELAALLASLARDPELRARLGHNGQETFRGAHTLEHRRQEFARALAELDQGRLRASRSTAEARV
jgi:glycosyltransferase involved in cell wall biosynthesis